MPIILLLALAILLVVLLGRNGGCDTSWSATGSSGLTCPETGGELARHLLDVAGLHGVKVELTGDGDHYDPEEPAVRTLAAASRRALGGGRSPSLRTKYRMPCSMPTGNARSPSALIW
jgi:Zn-dependent membrane protease YugP